MYFGWRPKLRDEADIISSNSHWPAERLMPSPEMFEMLLPWSCGFLNWLS